MEDFEVHPVGTGEVLRQLRAEREAQTHELKIWPEYFEPIVNGQKTFELRKDDRDFQVGDTLLLREWDPIDREYTGKETKRKISYVLRDAWLGIVDGYAVLSISQPMPEAAAQWLSNAPKLTEKMIEAGERYLAEVGGGGVFWRGFPATFRWYELWTAMLSASPAAPEGAKPDITDAAIEAYWGPLADRGNLSAQQIAEAVADYQKGQPPHPQPQAQSATLRQCANPDSAGPEGVKPCNYPDCKCPTETPCLQGRVQPQAQGEPDEREAFEAHWYNFYHSGSVVARQDGSYIGRNVQNAWEAWQARAQSHREAIAKRDAALVACVEALKLAKTIIVFNQRPTGNVGAVTIDAAITQANGVLGK